jgi:hypothetical protein
MHESQSNRSGALARLAGLLGKEGGPEGLKMNQHDWDMLFDEAVGEALREARGLNWPAPAGPSEPVLDGPEWDALDRKFEEEMIKKEQNERAT